MSAPRAGGFATLSLAADQPIRLVLVGAGEMGRTWIDSIAAHAGAELVGLVDLNVPLAEQALADAGLTGVAVGTSVAEVAARVGAHAVVNVTIPVAHHPVSVESLFAGLPVLCEKPVAPTTAEAISLAASAETSGQLLMVSQSRRYFNGIRAFREQVVRLGELGSAHTTFHRAPRFGGFRDQMDHVLLIDMAIHAFDASRYLLGLEPISVYCEEYNPGWSWFRADAAATAIFEFDGGLRYTYAGSWCADGSISSWNGEWYISGENGSARWDGDGAPVLHRAGDDPETARLVAADARPEETRGSLAEFLSALRTGAVPPSEVHANVRSLAMVEAAVRSAEIGARVSIDSVVEDGYRIALADERRDDVRATLQAWGSARAGLATAH